MNSLKLRSFLVFVRVFCFSLLSWLPIQVFSQIHYERLQGTIVDSATTQSIPQANIWTNHSSTISDADGNFSLFVYQGDTVHFSHVSYYDLAIRYDTKIDKTKIISLRLRIRLLDEVRIYSYLSESAFRQKIIDTTPVLSNEEEIALTNSKIISYLARYAPPCPMDANDNHIEYMKGPQGVVIFSNKPNKGLIRAIKNVVSQNYPSFKKFYKADSLSAMRTNANH